MHPFNILVVKYENTTEKIVEDSRCSHFNRSKIESTWFLVYIRMFLPRASSLYLNIVLYKPNKVNSPVLRSQIPTYQDILFNLVSFFFFLYTTRSRIVYNNAVLIVSKQCLLIFECSKKLQVTNHLSTL